MSEDADLYAEIKVGDKCLVWWDDHQGLGHGSTARKKCEITEVMHGDDPTHRYFRGKTTDSKVTSGNCAVVASAGSVDA
jgi:hypothetical protein